MKELTAYQIGYAAAIIDQSSFKASILSHSQHTIIIGSSFDIH